MSKLIKSRVWLFVLFMTIVIQLYWLFGVEGYQSANTFGYLVLVLPAVLLFFFLWKKKRGSN